MSTHKHFDRICAVVTVLAILLTVLFMNGEALGMEMVVDEDAEAYTGSVYFTEKDLDADWDTDGACTITLTGDGAKISGSGAYVYDGGVVIHNGGTYVISGTLTDGSITVDAYKSSKVWILLDGVDVTCSDDACLIVDQTDKVFVTLAEGSENTLTSGAVYSEEALSDNTGGVIFAHDTLTINGSGSLAITAGYKHGIDANDKLVIAGGDISITSAADAIHVNEEFNLTGASLTIAAGDDAIHSDTSIYMESGTILISDCKEGLEAPVIEIDGGDITVYPEDDGLNANGEASGVGFGGMPGDTAEGAAEGATDSDEGETYIRINGGTVRVINPNGRDADGLDSNGNIYINGGTVIVQLSGSGGNCALDYGSESGGILQINGGEVLAFGDSSMVEEVSETSAQCAVLYNLDTTAEAGTAFSVLDASGASCLSFTPETSYSSVVFSCPEMTVGETYTISTGDSSEDLTLTSVTASVGTSAGMGMGGPGGNGGFGGRGEMGGTDSTGDTGEMGSTGDAGEDEGFGGSRPEMPADGSMPERPSDGSISEMSEEGGQAGMQHTGHTISEDASASDAAISSGTATASGGYTTNIWILFGSSLLVLAAGLVLTRLFRSKD